MKKLLVLVMFLGIVGMPGVVSAVSESAMMDDFEGYTDNADLYAQWGEVSDLYNPTWNVQSFGVSLDTTESYDGDTSMKVQWDSLNAGGNVFVDFDAGHGQPRSGDLLALLNDPRAIGIRFAFKGDAGNEAGYMQFVIRGALGVPYAFMSDPVFGLVLPNSVNPSNDGWYVIEYMPNGGLPMGGGINGLSFEAVVMPTGAGGTFWLDSIEVLGVPEPATMTLLGFGAIALFSRKKR